ncbi:MAG: recombination protein RecR [Alphaproteobacteria bacterium]|nr:recombination protein RecR [Alphaproteobacteria bacterium]
MRHAVTQLSRFPGIGERTATRLAYWLLRQPPEVAAEIADGIQQLRVDMGHCATCCNVSGSDPCPICRDPDRDTGLVCVVERPQDVGAIENSGAHRGRYHVLDGAISPLDGVGPDELRIRELLARVGSGEIQEIVVATDPDVEGDATALYLAQVLKPLGVRVTRLAHGIAVGTEIEYADRSSVARALENRREM